MLTTRRTHRLIFAGLAALAVVLVYGLTDPGGSQAQTPPDATATFQAEINQLQQQLQQQQQQLSQQAQSTPLPGQVLQQQLQVPPSPTPTLPPLNVTPVATAVPGSATATTAPPGVTPVTAAPVAAVAQAQDACALSLATVSGGQTIEFQDVDVALPPGNFVYGFVRPDSGATPQVVVCNMQTTSTIYINALTGREVARRANGDAGTTSLNQILAGVRARGSTSTPAISPPNTGDAGLR